MSLPPSLTVATCTSRSSTSTSASVSICPLRTSPCWSTRQAHGLDAVAHDLEGNLLQVEDDIGGVFDHARDRAEFVLHAFDPHRRDGRAFNRAQQHAAQAVADGGAEPALKRLGRKHAIPFRKGLGIGDQTFGFLKALKHRILA